MVNTWSTFFFPILEPDSLVLVQGIITWILKSQTGLYLHSGNWAIHEFKKEYETYFLKCFPGEGMAFWAVPTLWTSSRKETIYLTGEWD